MKVFVVKVDDNNWDYYDEIMIISGKTVEEFRNDYSSENLQLDNICVSYHEGEKDLKWWCCELSQSFGENLVTNTNHHSESFVEETKDEEIENVLLENMNQHLFEGCCFNTSS